LWYGFAIGSGLLTGLLYTRLLFIDWEKEVIKSRIRSERYRHDRLDIVSTPRPGSLSVGSVPISHVMGDTEDREMAELEMVEFGIDKDDRVNPLHGFKSDKTDLSS